MLEGSGAGAGFVHGTVPVLTDPDPGGPQTYASYRTGPVSPTQARYGSG
jgi:hypothetical protein